MNTDCLFIESNNEKFKEWQKSLKMNVFFYAGVSLFLSLIIYLSMPLKPPYSYPSYAFTFCFGLISVGYITKLIIFNKGLRLTNSGFVFQKWNGADIFIIYVTKDKLKLKNEFL